MSEIQDEAYTEAMDEISRLRARIENMMKNQAEGLRIREAQIAGLKALLIRAADALESWTNNAPIALPNTAKLIAELRKAAE